MADPSRTMFRQMVRLAKQFPSYNFREYALRRIRTEFRERRVLDVVEARKALALLQRQALVQHMYHDHAKGVIET